MHCKFLVITVVVHGHYLVTLPSPQLVKQQKGVPSQPTLLTQQKEGPSQPTLSGTEAQRPGQSHSQKWDQKYTHSGFSVDLWSGLIKINTGKLRKHDCDLTFCTQLSASWRHEQGQHKWQKHQMCQRPTEQTNMTAPCGAYSQGKKKSSFCINIARPTK